MDLDDDLPRDAERDVQWDELGEDSQDWESRVTDLVCMGVSSQCAHAMTVAEMVELHGRCRGDCACQCHRAPLHFL